MKGRHETCKVCGLDWNVSELAVIDWRGYICPVCRAKLRKEAQPREGSGNKDARERQRRLRRDPFAPE